MHEQQQFAPWGVVSPTFWQTADHQRAEAAPALPSRESAPVATEGGPQAAPAPLPRPEQRIDAAPVPHARGAGPATAEDAPPEAGPQVQEESVEVPPTEHQRPHDSEPSAVRPEAAAERQQDAAGGGEPGGPPAEYRDRINDITAVFDAADDLARLAAAAVDAERLDQEFTARYGQQHANTINLRELRGHLAYLQGQLGVAVRWCLHTAGLQTQLWGSGHQVTQGSVQRAVHIWLSIPDPQESLTIGRELLTMLEAVTGEDSGLSRKVRARLEAMSTPGGATQ